MNILSAIESTSFIKAMKILRSGGVVAHATETCYGLTCDLQNPDAVKKVFDIKKRPYDMPVSALFSSIEAAQAFCTLSDRALELAKKYLPGPLTIIVPVRENSSPLFITAGRNPATEAGIRISPHPVAEKLSTMFGSPLITTSANVHGNPNPYSTADVQEEFEGALTPDLILDSGELPSTPASTVVRIRDDHLEILRQGSVSVDISESR